MQTPVVKKTMDHFLYMEYIWEAKMRFSSTVHASALTTHFIEIITQDAGIPIGYFLNFKKIAKYKRKRWSHVLERIVIKTVKSWLRFPGGTGRTFQNVINFMITVLC